MSSIPVEIFRHVLGYFSKDKSSLFSCLLVNKTWCEIVVSILWSDPFQFANEPSTSLITTYLSCLNANEREILVKSGIDLKVLFERKPTFEYASFLRNLKYVDFYDTSSEWLRNTTTENKDYVDFCDSSSECLQDTTTDNKDYVGFYDTSSECLQNTTTENKDHVDFCDTSSKCLQDTTTENKDCVTFYDTSSECLQDTATEKLQNTTTENKARSKGHDKRNEDSTKIFIITRELCKLFMNRCSKILKLNINLESIYPSDLPDNLAEYVSIPCFLNAKTSLSQLQEFHCCGNYDKKKIFLVLSQYCTNLTSLIIDYYLDDTRTSAPADLARLIKSQRSLQTFKIYTYYRNLSKIIPALESQRKTLREIVFRGIDFEEGVTFESLVSCYNLETLIFMACDNVKNEATRPLETAYFPKLKKLIFHVEPNNPPLALSSLIVNNSITLQEITLGLPPIYDSQDDPKIIEKIIENCQNLIVFEGHLQINQLKSLLVSCNRLEKLIVRGREPLRADDFLPDIGKMIPINLRTLIINALWSFSFNTLKEFLDYCVAPLVTLGFPDCYAINDNHLMIFSEYAKEKGSLKKLNIKSASHITRKAFEMAKSDIEYIEHCGSYSDDDDEKE